MNQPKPKPKPSLQPLVKVLRDRMLPQPRSNCRPCKAVNAVVEKLWRKW